MDVRNPFRRGFVQLAVAGGASPVAATATGARVRALEMVAWA